MKAEKITSFTWLPAVIFSLSTAFYILFAFYQDMLFTAHLRTPYLEGSMFFGELTSTPFGIMRWAGCWLTQFCYYPLLGIAFYIVIWCATYFVAAKALDISGTWVSLLILPLACLLLSVVDLGYWIYCMLDLGYWFSHSLAYLLMFVCLYLIRKSLAKARNMTGIATLIIIMFYPVLGWYGILMSLMLVALEWKRFRYESLIFLLPCLSPFLWVSVYSGVPERELWLGGFPIFEDGANLSLRPSIPFIALAVFSLLLPFVPKKKTQQGKKATWIHVIAADIVLPVIVFLGVELLMFKDYNYLAEMRMTKCALEEDWIGVLRESEKQQAPSRSMVLLKNLALLNVGELGELAFKTHNDGREIKNPDGLNLSAMQIVSPVVYYNYGKINYATRWANEFAVCYGYSPYYLMILAKAAKAKGERQLSEKYLESLHGHHFYRDWQPSVISPLAKEIEMAFGNVIDADNNNMEAYLIDTFSQSYGSDNPTVKELSLFNAMLYGNAERFWKAFVSYVMIDPERVLPQHYQEAYFLFMEAAPIELPCMVKISSGMAEAYSSFRQQYDTLVKSGYKEEEIAQALKINWGGSYWWHYFFAKKTY